MNYTDSECGWLSVKSSLFLLALVLAGVLALGVGLVARVHETARLRTELTDVRRQVQEQEILHPLFRELERTGAAPLGSELLGLVKKPMSSADIVGVPDRFAKLADACQLKLGAVRPRLVGEDDQTRQMVVDVQMTGSYAQLRPLLMGLLAWPSFINLERLEVVEQRMHEEFNLSVRLALK